MKKYKVNIKNQFVSYETRTLPIEYQHTEQRFWTMRGITPVNILMSIKEINEKKGTVTYECKIPIALLGVMK